MVPIPIYIILNSLIVKTLITCEMLILKKITNKKVDKHSTGIIPKMG